MIAHSLTIEPGIPGGHDLQGRIVFADGTETMVYADDRARIIAAAQRAIEQYARHQEMAQTEPERLYLDEHGEIIRGEVAP